MRFQIVIYVIFLFNICCNAQLSTPYYSDNEFYFFHLTDPQFGFIDQNEGFQKETLLYERAVRNINRLEPKFVVITGDFVHDYSDTEQWDEFFRITRMIKSSISVYIVPGNHEYIDDPTENDFLNYSLNFGDDKFSVFCNGNLFIGLNSNLINSNLYNIENQQFEWLKNILNEADKRTRKFIFTHHPFFVVSPDEPDNYKNIKSQMRNKYLKLFENNNVVALFSGHLHKNNYNDLRDIRLISTSAVGKQLGDDSSGLRIVKVGKKKFSDKYFSLEELEKCGSLNGLY